mmetsp:Transcript_3011/g.6568  ORF Transcript_3011/g.6568 Transcript_3011/m.6568 type:complete len:160 (+) Transcript_3011:118-597(+)|eukprot:CAMPEP_0172309756 /NCGR_PEP_ID=MMETSP1058-20130122/10592_1 /TAXON_ID=83371 /ORGANISM="Detonula confervacea, Strain CCMP 353" /LENGTH=159 /DNA_ID=CAMNT_0013022437 /DNA_START=113 /DNA_END=592 /DNA_ORIENTATION=+
MKSVAILVATTVAVCSSDVTAFSSFSGQQLKNGAQNAGRTMTMEYIPSGMSKAQWQKIKDQEKAGKGKDLGKVGITSFKSRSFSEWQKAGGKNLFPVDPNSVKSQSEIPYMQRAGGDATGADLKGGAKKKAPTFFNMGGKKKAPEPVAEPIKKKNWWTL